MNATAAAGETRSPGVIKWFEGLLLVGMIVMCLSIVAIVLSKPGDGPCRQRRSGRRRRTFVPDRLRRPGATDGLKRRGPGRHQPTAGEGRRADRRPVHLSRPKPGTASGLVDLAGERPAVDTRRSVAGVLDRPVGTGRQPVRRPERAAAVDACRIDRRRRDRLPFFSGVAAMLMFRGSTAAGLTETAFTISFLPIIVGSGVAALASVWHAGVALQDDVAGMI